MSERPLEISPQLPQGLEVLGAGAIEENRRVGEDLFGSSDFGKLLDMAGGQVEEICRKRIAAVGGTRPEVRKAVGDALQRKRGAREKEKLERQTERLQRKRSERLEGRANLVSDVAAGELDIIESRQEQFRGENRDVGEEIVTSIADARRLRDKAEEAAGLARAEGEAVRFREVVAGAVGKLPEHIRARLGLKDVEDAQSLISRTQKELPLYQAGLVVAAERVVREAGEGKPLQESVFREAEILQRIQDTADGVGARLARRLDKLVQSKVLREEGRFEALVLGLQKRRDIAINRDSRWIIEQINETLSPEGYPPEAVTRAADQIRVLVEKLGFGRRPLGDELLTTEGLNQYQKTRLDEIIDPARRWIYEHFARRSVAEALGCRVIVTGTGKERKTDFQPLSPEEEPRETPLFAKLVQCEALDIEFRRALHNTEPTDIEGVQTLVAALRTTDKLRQALLRTADARINGLFVADGVRSGALRLALAETGVKAVEGAIVAGFVYWATYRWGVTPKLEEAELIRAEAQRILSAPDQLADLWRMIENLAPGLDLTELRTAISAHSSEFAKIATSGIADKTAQLSSLLSKVIQLEKLATMGPPRAAELMEKAQIVTRVAQIIRIGGAAGGIAACAASMTEAFRRAAMAPVRGARSLVRGRVS